MWIIIYLFHFGKEMIIMGWKYWNKYKKILCYDINCLRLEFMNISFEFLKVETSWKDE
jgi:hypothetical protein